MKLLLISILTFVWAANVYFSVPGIISASKFIEHGTLCHTQVTDRTIDSTIDSTNENEDCCTKFHKSVWNCEETKEGHKHNETDDCCKTSHCPRTCCQIFVLNLNQTATFTFGITSFHNAFGELNQSNLMETYLGVTTPPPNMFHA